MNETRVPRRPLVPGPSSIPSSGTASSGIAAKAVAVREAAREQKMNASSSQAAQQAPTIERAPRQPIALPVTGIGGIAKGISGVMSEVGTIKKGGYNKFHGYHYARLEDLLEAITPLMGRHGIVIIQNEVERTIVESRIAVTYAFSIIHTSGEVWPEQPRFTGMSIARDSKGNWDDKCINKCHSAARKYFLLSLFQVPAGDFDDPDASTVVPTDTRDRVPGPAKAATVAAAAAKPTSPTHKPSDDRPHKISLGQGAGPDQWADAYIARVEKAKSEKEIREWDTINNNTLQNLNDNYSGIYDRIEIAVQERLAQIRPAPTTPDVVPDVVPDEALRNVMPDPRLNTQEAMNWIAQQLMDLKTYEAAEMFWNQVVAPREQDFDEVDWGLLLTEWQRTEQRLRPPEDELSVTL